MGRMRYFKCYPGDLLQGTSSLNDDQFALYVRLFMYMYDQGGPVPFDTQKLKHVVHKRPQDIRRIVAQLVTMGKLSVAEGRLRNGRVDEMTEKWTSYDRLNETPSNRSNGAPEEAKSATNSTRAPAHANDRVPEARTKNNNTGGVFSTASARPEENLTSYLLRKIQASKLERQGKEIEHDHKTGDKD